MNTEISFDEPLACSDFLFAVPSFGEGVGRIFDWGDALSVYNQSEDGRKADALALWMDMRAVGADLVFAIQNLRAGASGGKG